MAASSCSPAFFTLPGQTHLRNEISSLLLMSSVSQSQLNRRFGVSLTTEKGIVARKSSYPLSVSCIGDTKAAVVTGKSWDKLVLGSATPVLVEFYASWCGPCRMVHRLIDEIATDYSGKLNCFVLEADKDVQIAEKYDIKAVPVVILFKNGEKQEFIVGTMPKEFYVSAIERVMAL